MGDILVQATTTGPTSQPETNPWAYVGGRGRKVPSGTLASPPSKRLCCERAQWVKELAAKPADFSSIPRPYMVEKRINSPKERISSLAYISARETEKHRDRGRHTHWVGAEEGNVVEEGP